MAPGQIRSAVFGVASVIFLSKLLGFFREMIIANNFGTGNEYDLYLIAIMLPALLYGILNYTSLYLLVPYFSARINLNNSNNESVWHEIWTIINYKLIVGFTLTILFVLSAPYLMKIWGGGYDASDYTQIIFYSRVTSIAVLFSITEAVIRAFLNVKKDFVYPASSFIVFNLISISCIIIFSNTLSVGAIALGWVGGLFLQNLFLIIRLFKYDLFKKYQLILSGKYIKEITAIGSLIILIELINRSYFLIDRYFAAQFGEGVISAINYSNVLVVLPDSIIGFALASVMFPLFSETYKNDKHNFSRLYTKTISLVLLIAIPLAVIFFIKAAEIIDLIFLRGAFDSNSAALTVSVLKPLTPAIIALFVISISIRASYSGSWAKPVLIFAGIALVIKIFFTWLLSVQYGYAGITTASSLAYLSFGVLMVVYLLIKTDCSEIMRFNLTVVRLLLAGIIAGLTAVYINIYLDEIFSSTDKIVTLLQIFLTSTIVISVYLLLIYLFRLGYLTSELFKKTRVQD